MAAIGRRDAVAANKFDPPPGNKALRVQCARRLIEAGCALGPEDIITTAGGTEALNLCLRAVAKPGDVIAVESPTFFGILHIINSLAMKVCEIPTHPRDGVILSELSRRLKCCRIKACIFTLNYSNPLGSCMTDEKKRELVQLLASHEIPLIEDDVYGNLGYGPNRPIVAKAYDRDGLVMVCVSFTKTLAPGYRIGYVVPGRFKSKVELLKYVHTSATASLPQMAIAEFLQSGGYDHHLRRMRRFHATEVARMTEAVVRHFPPGTRVTRPSAPDDANGTAWLRDCPEVSQVLKQCAQLRSQFLKCLTEGTLIGECLLAEPCPGTHVDAYTLPEKVLCIIMNTEEQARSLTFKVKLEPWLPSGADKYQVQAYDEFGKSLGGSKTIGHDWTGKTPRLKPHEFAIFEFTPR